MPGFELINKKERKAVIEVFDKSNGVLFAHGFDARRNNIFRVRDFEKSFAGRLQASNAAACSSGTAALFVAMKVMGVKEGDEVITQAFTFIATVEAILACGARPVIVDIDHTYNMDPKALENAITNKTKLIVPVHMLGNPAEMDTINSIAKKHNIPVLEDACEALGATYKGTHTGLLGNAGVFSLDFGKTITTGEGGMIISNNDSIIKHCLQYIDHGHECDKSLPRGRDTASFFGFNFRMTELQAAVGLVQIEKLDFILKKNRAHKKIIKTIIGQSDKIKFRTITDKKGDLADTIIFNVETPQIAERLVTELGKKGVGTKNVPDAMRWHFAGYFTQIWNNLPYYPDFETAWKKSDDLLSRSISLPVMVNWKKDEAADFAEKVLKTLNAI